MKVGKMCEMRGNSNPVVNPFPSKMCWKMSLQFFVAHHKFRVREKLTNYYSRDFFVCLDLLT